MSTHSVNFYLPKFMGESKETKSNIKVKNLVFIPITNN